MDSLLLEGPGRFSRLFNDVISISLLRTLRGKEQISDENVTLYDVFILFFFALSPLWGEQCAAKLEAGKVDIGEAALADEVKEAGFVLTCSAFPRSEGIKLKMQEFDDAYDMQYGQYEKESQEKAEKEKKSGFLSGLFGNK